LTDNDETHNSVGPEATPLTDNQSAVGLKKQFIDRKKRRSFNKKLISVAAGVLLVGGFLTVYKSVRPDSASHSHISRGPNINSTPAGQQLAESERYRNNLNETNRVHSELASKAGKSFIATPDEPLRDVDDKANAQTIFRKPVAPANEPEPEPEPKENIVAPVRQEVNQAPPLPTPPDYRRIYELAAAISSQANSYAASWQPHEAKNTIILNQRLYKTPEQRRQEQLDRERAASEAMKQFVTPGIGNAITAGRVVYGWVVNSADSDTPGPVVAEILEKGPLYKARLVGSFKTNQTTSGLIIQFNRIAFPDGTETDVQAYAVDSTKGTISVKSEVNKRYLERYGALIAASFIEGLGSTLSDTGSTIAYGGYFTHFERPEASLQQGLLAGAGKVGQRMSHDIEQAAPKGPLVKLNAGRTIGILFMQGVKTLTNPGLPSIADAESKASSLMVGDE